MRFSLRTLIVVMLLAGPALAGAWFAWEWMRTANGPEAVAASNAAIAVALLALVITAVWRAERA